MKKLKQKIVLQQNNIMFEIEKSSNQGAILS